MTWYYATSVSVTNGATVVSVNTGDDVAIAQAEGGLIIGTNPPVEIKRTYLDASSNKKIELAKPWPYATQTNQQAYAYPTDGDFAAATATLQSLIDGFTLAAQADALAGTDTAKPMTALRVHQAFQQYGLGAGAIDLPNFTAATANSARFFRFINTAVGKPSFINYGSGISLPYDGTPNTYFAGVGLRADSTRALFYGYKSGAAGTPTWLEAWDKGKNPAQSHLADIGGGAAVLTAGSFGWGGTSTAPQLALLSATLDTTTLPSGAWRVIAADTGTKPPGYTDFNMLQMRYNSSDATRIAIGTTGEMFSYASAGGVWNSTGWRRQYDSLNAQGTVNHDGTKNTGAIMEYGANANGQYYKYLDGRLECYLSRSVAMTADVDDVFTWTFPSVFANAPTFIKTAITGASNTHSFNITKDAAHGQTTTGATCRTKVNSSQTHTLTHMAVGRWR
ncbi:MAG TPA: hypothetical protein DCS87_11615 [Rheinheimera sp.]|nr:hypothetical protein [Rheinheimera sp.]